MLRASRLWYYEYESDADAKGTRLGWIRWVYRAILRSGEGEEKGLLIACDGNDALLEDGIELTQLMSGCTFTRARCS